MRSSRPKADWVFRGNTFDTVGAAVLDDGSYHPAATVLTPGVPAANAFILYDSHNRMQQMVNLGVNFSGQFPMAYRAEGGKAFIRWVKGELIITPSTWALGSVYFLGLRFGIFEQDAATGLLLVDPAYSMWNVSTNNSLQAAVWANDRQWQHERHVVVQFNDNNLRHTQRFSFPVKRSLRPNMCYALFAETAVGSVNVTLLPFFRTLVSDEG